MGPMLRSAAIVLLATAFCGCQRAAQAGARTTTPAAAVTSRTVVPRPPAATASTAPATASTAPAAASTAPAAASTAPAAVAADGGLLALLARGAQDGALPEDFEIGPLAAARLASGDERSALAQAAVLLDAWVAGRVERAPLAAGARDAVAGTIGFALERGDVPRAWRLGPPRAHGGELIANLRLLAAAGSAEGEIYAAREGAAIVVSDLQVDPARLRVPRGERPRAFFPSPYRWLLGG